MQVTPFAALSEDVRCKLMLPCAPLLVTAADAGGAFTAIPDLVCNSSTLNPTAKLVYGHYWTRIKRTQSGGELLAKVADVCALLNVERTTLWRAHRELHDVGLLPTYDARSGLLMLTPPDQLLVAHLLLLQPHLARHEWSKTLRETLSALLTELPHGELLLPWLTRQFGGCKNATTLLRKRNVGVAKMQRQKMLEIVSTPLQIHPLHLASRKGQSREKESVPAAGTATFSKNRTTEKDATMPKLPPLRDADDLGDDEPTGKLVTGPRPIAASDREAVKAVFRQTFRHRPVVKAQDMPADDLDEPVGADDAVIVEGPQKPRWPMLHWARFLIATADKHRVPLWCDDAENNPKATRSILSGHSKFSNAMRRTVRLFVENLLVGVLLADRDDPHADLPRLQALAALIDEWFRNWTYFCGHYLSKPASFRFHPAYFAKAVAPVREWFVTTGLVTRQLPREEALEVLRNARLAKERGVMDAKKARLRRKHHLDSEETEDE